MQEFYQIYLSCITTEILSYDKFLQFLQSENKEIVEYREENLLGFAVIEKNKILFLGVKPIYRNNKIGSKLLELSETKIKAKGYDKILLNSILVPRQEHHFGFFEKRGYEDIYIDSDFRFDKINTKGNNEYEFRVNDYHQLKLYLPKLDLKKSKKIDFDKKLLLCLHKDKLLGYCQYTTGEFEELGNVGIIENMYILPEYHDLQIEQKLIEKVQLSLNNISKILLVSYNSSNFRKSNEKYLYIEHITAVKLLNI